MWENLKKDVKKMVDKKHELETQHSTRKAMQIEELAMMTASLIQSDMFEALITCNENYLSICTCRRVQADNTFTYVSCDHDMGMIKDRIRRNVPDWVIIKDVRHWDSSTGVKLTVEYIIDEAKVCEE